MGWKRTRLGLGGVHRVPQLGECLDDVGCADVLRQLPELQAILVEVPSKIGPFGAKPVGEPPIIPGGAVIANAVHAATGARVTELPLSSERVRTAMETTGTNGKHGQYS